MCVLVMEIDPLVARENLIEWLNSIRWQENDGVSGEALDLIADYVGRVNPVVKAIAERDGIEPDDVHLLIEGVGQNIPCGEALVNEMTEIVRFENAPVATPMMFSIAAAYCWEADPRVNTLPNPWPPLMDLCGLGYTVTFDFDDDGDSGVVLQVGCKSGIERFRVL